MKPKFCKINRSLELVPCEKPAKYKELQFVVGYKKKKDFPHKGTTFIFTTDRGFIPLHLDNQHEKISNYKYRILL